MKGRVAATLCLLLLCVATTSALWSIKGKDAPKDAGTPDFYWYNPVTKKSEWQVPQYEFTDGALKRASLTAYRACTLKRRKVAYLALAVCRRRQHLLAGSRDGRDHMGEARGPGMDLARQRRWNVSCAGMVTCGGASCLGGGPAARGFTRPPPPALRRGRTCPSLLPQLRFYCTSGRRYYYNENTGVSQWEKPMVLAWQKVKADRSEL